MASECSHLVRQRFSTRHWKHRSHTHRSQLKNSTWYGTDFFQVTSKETLRNRGHLGSPWLERATRQIKNDPTRHIAFQQAFRSSVQWCWLHECGHAVLGHLQWNLGQQIGVNLFQDMFFASESDLQTTQTFEQNVSLVSELQADRYATGLLSLGLRNSINDNKLMQYLSSFTGFLAVPLCFYGTLLAQKKTDSCKTHPPLWSRAAMIKRESTKAFLQPHDSPSLVRRREYLVDQLLGNLSHLHASFGDLLAVASGSDSRVMLEKFESELVQKAAEIEPAVQSYSRTNFRRCQMD